LQYHNAGRQAFFPAPGAASQERKASKHGAAQPTA
jgi:hypothetical protein